MTRRSRARVLIGLVLLVASPVTVRSTEAPIRVIVTTAPGASAAVAALVEDAGGSVVQRLSVIDGFTADVEPADLALLRSVPAVRSVTPNQSVQLMSYAPGSYDPRPDRTSLFNLTTLIGARDMWNAYTGRGVDVAVLDSGVSPIAGVGGEGKLLQGPDLTEESQNPATEHLDTFGHGTHMAGIIAGRDDGIVAKDSPLNADAFLGVAPDARIVSVKVANARGISDVSQVIAGIDWIVQHANDPGMNIRVLNLSFGTDAIQSYGVDPLSFAVEVAWRNGIVVVTSAGNRGSTLGRLTNPATNPHVIAVGADDLHGSLGIDDDVVPAWSSTGDGVRDPDVVAPGVSVQSLRVAGSYIDNTYGATGTLPGGRYFRGSGTSQAAAIVAGSVALLLQQHPEYTPDQIKALLVTTAKPLRKTPRQAQGAGLVDMRSAKVSSVGAVTQAHLPSTGGGSIDAARGSVRTVLRGVELRGEVDIFGAAVDCTALAVAQASRTSWSGGTWNGTSWSGTSWSGTSWSGTSWSGNDWSGTSWSNANWSSGSWSGTSWSGTSWSGTSWSGTSWSGTSWSGTSWSNVWATVSWS